MADLRTDLRNQIRGVQATPVPPVAQQPLAPLAVIPAPQAPAPTAVAAPTPQTTPAPVQASSPAPTVQPSQISPAPSLPEGALGFVSDPSSQYFGQPVFKANQDPNDPTKHGYMVQGYGFDGGYRGDLLISRNEAPPAYSTTAPTGYNDYGSGYRYQPTPAPTPTPTPQPSPQPQTPLAQQTSAIQNSTPQPIQYTPRTYSTPTYSSGSSSGSSSGGSAPAPYRPSSYNGPTYSMPQFQAPQYEPVDLERYFSQYSQYLMPSEQETGIKQTINDLMASYRAGLTNIEGQPIAMQFVTGQSAAVDRQAEMEKANLLDALGLAQGNRLAMGDVAKAQYNFANEEALRRQHAGETAFNQWSTTQQLQISAARNSFDQWAAQEGLSQSAADQAFDQWYSKQQLNQQASQQNFNQWLQQEQLRLQAQGMTADEAYRAAQLAQNQQQFNASQQMTPYQAATLAENQRQFNATQATQGQMTDYQKAQTELDYAKQVAALQQQVAQQQQQQSSSPATSSSTTSTPRPSTTTSTPVSTPSPTPTSSPSSGYTGPSIVDYLNSVGQPSDYNSRAQLAARMGITNYTGTAAQNTQLLQMLRGGATSSTPTTTGRTRI